LQVNSPCYVGGTTIVKSKKKSRSLGGGETQHKVIGRKKDSSKKKRGSRTKIGRRLSGGQTAEKKQLSEKGLKKKKTKKPKNHKDNSKRNREGGGLACIEKGEHKSRVLSSRFRRG